MQRYTAQETITINLPILRSCISMSKGWLKFHILQKSCQMVSQIRMHSTAISNWTMEIMLEGSARKNSESYYWNHSKKASEMYNKQREDLLTKRCLFIKLLVNAVFYLKFSKMLSSIAHNSSTCTPLTPASN